MDDIKDLQEEELTKEEILMSEADLIRGLFEAADEKQSEESYHFAEVVRDGALKFKFRIRGLGEDEYHKCKDDATKYVRNKSLGMKLPEETDAVKYRCLLIYTATHPDDRRILWDNKDAWKKYNCLTGWQMVDKALYAGEKDRILEILDDISGYKYNNLEAVAKNS